MIESTRTQDQPIVSTALVDPVEEVEESVRLVLPTQRTRRPAVTAVVRVVGVDALDPARTGEAVSAAADLTDTGEVLVVNLTRHHPTAPDLPAVLLGCAEALSLRGAVLVVAGTTGAGWTAPDLPVRATVAEAAEAAMARLSTSP